MATKTANTVRLLAVLLATLAPCNPAPGQVLYRCALPDRPPAWQDRPCPAGATQAELAFDPAAAVGSPAVDVPTGERGQRQRGAALAPVARARSRARRVDAGTSACLQARRTARLRTDADGRRLPVRTIRSNERRMRNACGAQR